MPSEINTLVMDELSSSLTSQENLLFIDASRLNSEETYAFRKKLSDDNSRMKVIRNRIFGVATKEGEKAGVDQFCKGPTAVVYGEDPVAISKQVVDLQKDNANVAIKGGFCLGQILSENEINKLAKIPSRQVLLTQLVSTLNSPISGFVNVLAGPMRGMVTVLNAIKDKQDN